MKRVSLYDAKTHLSNLLDEAEAGKQIVITRRGNPIAKLVGLTATAKRRTLGSAKGQVIMADDFDAPMNEFAEYSR